jgi:hypothetical protein
MCHRRKGGRFLLMCGALSGYPGKYFMHERKYCLHLLEKIKGGKVVPDIIMGLFDSSILFIH